MPTTNRHEIEASVAPAASSIDGRRVTFQCSVHDHALRPGGYVAIGRRLGQVHAIEQGVVEISELAAHRGGGEEARALSARLVPATTAG